MVQVSLLAWGIHLMDVLQESLLTSESGHNCSNMESKEVSFLIFVRQLFFAYFAQFGGSNYSPKKEHTHTAHHTKKDRSLICFAAPGDIQDLKSPGTKEPHRLRDLRYSTINIWVLPSFLLALIRITHEEITFHQMHSPPKHQWEHLFVKNYCSAPWPRTSPLVQRRTPGIWSPILEAAPEVGEHSMMNRIFGWEPLLRWAVPMPKDTPKQETYTNKKLPKASKTETSPKIGFSCV